MTRDPWERRQKAKLVLVVLSVGIMISALLAVALVYMGQIHPRS